MFNNIQNQKQTNDINAARNVFNVIYNIQNLSHTHQLIKANQITLTSHIQELRNPGFPDPRVTLPQESEIFRRKIHRARVKNQKLKQQILLIKSKLKQELNIYDSSLNQNYEQIRAIQKIKQISTDIKSKILALKERKSAQRQIESDNPELHQKRKLQEYKMRPINVKIDQMGQGAEFLAKQLLGLKYDMQITEKYFKSYFEPERDQESKKKYF